MVRIPLTCVPTLCRIGVRQYRLRPQYLNARNFPGVIGPSQTLETGKSEDLVQPAGDLRR